MEPPDEQSNSVDPGCRPEEDLLNRDWLACSVEERIAGVWELTKLKYGLTSDDPPMDRTVTRIIRRNKDVSSGE